jgi:hypothetical protein
VNDIDRTIRARPKPRCIDDVTEYLLIGALAMPRNPSDETISPFAW